WFIGGYNPVPGNVVELRIRRSTGASRSGADSDRARLATSTSTRTSGKTKARIPLIGKPGLVRRQLRSRADVSDAEADTPTTSQEAMGGSTTRVVVVTLLTLIRGMAP